MHLPSMVWNCVSSDLPYDSVLNLTDWNMKQSVRFVRIQRQQVSEASDSLSVSIVSQTQTSTRDPRGETMCVRQTTTQIQPWLDHMTSHLGQRSEAVQWETLSVCRYSKSGLSVHDVSAASMWVTHAQRGRPSWTACYCYTTWTNNVWLIMLLLNVTDTFSAVPICILMLILQVDWAAKACFFCKLDVNCWWVIYLPVTLAEAVLVGLAVNVMLASLLSTG